MSSAMQILCTILLTQNLQGVVGFQLFFFTWLISSTWFCTCFSCNVQRFVLWVQAFLSGHEAAEEVDAEG